MPKHSTKAERKKVEPFLMIKTWELKSPAFRALTGDEVRVYIEMRMRYNGRNNGDIVFGGQMAGHAIHKSKATGSRILLRLVKLGFIKITKDSSFAQKGKCKEYELTALDRQPAKNSCKLPCGTKDFMRFTADMIETLEKH